MIGWVVGTIILWVLKIFVQPFSEVLVGKNAKTTTVNIVDDSGNLTGEKKVVKIVPTGIYILADCLILGVVGFLMGLIFGINFFAITWKDKDLPGMFVFIIASFLGSSLHG